MIRRTMEWNIVLLWVAGSSCGFNFFVAARATPRLWGWMGVCAAIGMAGAWLYSFRPETAGFVAGGCWLLFVLLPTLLQRRVHRLALAQQFARARRLSYLVRILHPFDGLWVQSRLFKAMEQWDRGEVDSATQLLESLFDASPRVARLARLHYFRLQMRWAELVEWVQSSVSPRALGKDPALFSLYIRALGESGRLDEMLSVLDQHRASMDTAQFVLVRPICRLHLFAFTGERERAAAVLQTRLSHMPVETRGFWLATAEMAAGERAAGQAILSELLPTVAPGSAVAMRKRLQSPPAVASSAISPQGREILDRLEREWDHEERYAPSLTTRRRPWVVYALVLMNVGMFIAESRMGGTTDPETLYRLGAFEPTSVEAGQYWRLLTANFLHFGAAHIAMNMLALLLLGPFVESAVGPISFLLVYLVSGVGAMVTVWMLQRLHLIDADLLAGASGAIMGLIGATTAILLRGWMRERVGFASRRLRTLVLMILFQVVFDRLNPQVSGSAHLAGMVWGFVLASVIPHRTGRKLRPLKNI